MKRSTNRFLTTHMGSLARPDDVARLLTAKDAGQPYDADLLARRIKESVAEVVRQQADNGIDIINDGEFSKFSWGSYFADRLGGIERRAQMPNPPPLPISARDMQVFPNWFAIVGPGGSRDLIRRVQPQSATTMVGVTSARRAYCTGPLTYIGQADTATDIANLKAAAQGLPAGEAGVQVEELYLSALAPATAEYFITNEYYKSQEELVFAYAEAMNHEYRAIADAGILLQIDEPAIITMWQVFRDLDVTQFRRWMDVRVEALNISLKGIPEDRVRMHCCWGSSHHPHSQDIPLRDALDILLKVNVGAYSLEAANPRHDGDWRVWQDIKLPEGKIVIPGVIGHFTDFIESPELVADRYLKYAEVCGKENVYGGTDCGIGTRVGHPEIGWAKFRSMRDGAALASKIAWG